MRATLVLLTLSGLAQSAQLYFHPPISIYGRLPRHLTSATVAKHLHLDRLTPLQENGPLYTGDIDRPFVGEGYSSSLLIAVDDADAECEHSNGRMSSCLMLMPPRYGPSRRLEDTTRLFA